MRLYLRPAALICGWVTAAAAVPKVGHEHRARVGRGPARCVSIPLHGRRRLRVPHFLQPDGARQHVLPRQDAVEVLHLQ